MSTFFKSRIRSLGFALNGIKSFFFSETNGRNQFIAALLITIAGFIFNISIIEWCLQLMCIALVLGFEMINSAVEKTIDLHSKEWNYQEKYVKDVSAGAVLIAALISLVVAMLIYLPKIVKILA